MGNRRKYFKIPCPDLRNLTNPDKLKLVNYSLKICNTNNFLSAKFSRENFDNSTCNHQICQTFPPSKFYAIRYEMYSSCKTFLICTSFKIKGLCTWFLEIAFVENLNSIRGEHIRMHMCLCVRVYSKTINNQ